MVNRRVKSDISIKGFAVSQIRAEFNNAVSQHNF